MADVKIPIQTKYDGAGFRQAQQDAAKLRRLQERHNRAVLQETKQQIADQRRLGNLTAKLERDLAKEAHATEKIFAQRNAQLRQWGQAAGIAVAAVGAFAVESVKLSEQADSVERSFVGLSGGAERAAANLAAMGRATRGLISEQEQETIANQLLGMRLVNNAQELETLVSGARRLGKEFKGMGAAESANDFALLLSNMSYLRLDQFGLSAGKVRERVNELKAAGMGAEEAFKTAVFEEMQTTLARLGPELATNTEQVQGLTAGWKDFQVEFGRAVAASGDASGAFDVAEGFLDKLTEGAKAWQGAAEDASLLHRAMEILNEEGNTTLGWMEQIPVIGGIIESADFWGSQVLRLEDLQKAAVQAGQELEEQKRQQEEAAKAAADATNAFDAETDALDDNSDALEEQAKRLADVAKARRNAARDLLDIQERAADETDEVWEEYWADQESGWQAHEKSLADLRKRAASEAKRDDNDLAKQLARLNTDTEKQIQQVKDKAAKEQKHESKRRAVDALADERLFNFELKQLAAEGNANAIQEALERRKIEEEIAKEKAAVESQIEAEQQTDEIARIRETASERRSQLQQDHAEEKALREERLAAELAAEEESYAERSIALRQWREEKLDEVEASRLEAIEALGRELAEAQDLTKTELQALTPVAGQLGEEAGKAFAEGLNKGFETNQRIEEMLGEPRTRRSAGSPRTRRSAGLPRFQLGGTVPGPIGAPTLAVVHGGEKITPVGQSATPINITVNASGGVNVAKIEALLQQFTDEVLAPALQ